MLAQGNHSAAFADQDIFLIAGAGIAGLVSVSAQNSAAYELQTLLLPVQQTM